jgi:hypothetical protein
MHDRKIEEAAEICCAGAQPVQGVRQTEGLSQEIWDVQDLFQTRGASGSDSRSYEIKLVEVTDGN